MGESAKMAQPDPRFLSAAGTNRHILQRETMLAFALRAISLW